MKIKKIGVVGAGQMGTGIAQTAIQFGYQVLLRDNSEELTKKSLSKIEKNLSRLVEKGKMTEEQKKGQLALLQPSPDLRSLAQSDLVIEAISENPKIKIELFRELDKLAPKETILASNTSSISITMLGSVTSRPEQVIGIHFFNPVPVMKLVEVVRSLRTSDATFQTAMGLAESMGKTPVSVKDSPAFVVNRILLPMINEAIYVLQEGITDAKGIDSAMKMGCNHPMGPLELADFVGLDTILAVLEVLYQDMGNAKYHPAPLLRKYVEAGWLGRKSGRGFFDYSEQKQ
ncbi:MAG: 3-hydroxybutyryl-CoA dehydrogenase [Deltaproteobacteria bacterium]|nr:3-hydroxybutyryl-CoA dehydrogenase [Deltaproteobacteria bacterium]